MKKSLVLAVILALLALSCSNSGGGGSKNDGSSTETSSAPVSTSSTPTPYAPTAPETPIGMEKKFWALNLVNYSYYQVTTELLASNTHCEVWVEKGHGVTAAKARDIANAYGSGVNSVYQKLLGALGSTYTIDVRGKPVLMNTMDYADYLGDGNGKVTILLLDIIDGYNGNNGFVVGYFAYLDYFSDPLVSGEFIDRTNERDMIYMDINPSMNYFSESEYYRTLAHETQHMMNYVTGYLLYSNGKRTEPLMDLWINEGLSSAAEWIYSGKARTDRIDWYNTSSTIPRGKNFFSWSNEGDDYATVYLFFQWLRKQDSEGIYKKILTSEHYDYKAVTKSYKTGAISWPDLLGTWLAANYIKHDSNEYGYKGDPDFNAVKARYYDAGYLYPGEGVYSYPSIVDTNTSAFPNTENIRRHGLTTEGVSSNIPVGHVLLTFNENSNKNDGPAYGGVMGVAPRSSETRVSVLSEPSGPYPISAAAALKRNGVTRNAFEIPGKIDLLKYMDRLSE